ncbi:MAG TPA: hypothetical protein VLX90_18345 [Steroidobacteraceae bacterium]|nr:hypothetical protein [Steroidobacteraceae bacterium]
MLVATAAADGQISPRFATSQISSEQWQTYLSEVKVVADVQCKVDADSKAYMCRSSAQRTLWVFTRKGHPAHPAVFRGVIVIQQTPQGPSVDLDRSGHYAGNRAAFEVWMKEFGA